MVVADHDADALAAVLDLAAEAEATLVADDALAHAEHTVEAVRRLLGDDVDGREEGVSAIERGERALGDLDALDGVERDVLLAEESGEVGAEVHLHAVDHDAHESRAAAQAGADAAHAERRHDQVIADVQAGCVGEHLGERRPAVAAELVALPGDDVRGRQGA